MNKKIIRFKFFIALNICLFALVGCGSDTKSGELYQYVEKIKKRPPGKVEPIPVFTQPPAQTYQAKNLRSPFEIQRIHKKDALTPDKNRPKEPLEVYQLDSLKMVGTIWAGSQVWALILAPNGTVYHVRVGNYIGTNYGRIIKIDKNKVYISETVPDQWGAWKARSAILKLRGAR